MRKRPFQRDSDLELLQNYRVVKNLDELENYDVIDKLDRLLGDDK